MAQKFSSKVDWWIGLLVASGPLICIGVTVSLLLAGEGVFAGALCCVFMAVLYAGVVFPLNYEVTDESLVIRFGMVRSRVNYADIRKVVPTRNPLSNPALSLDRLHIDTGNALGPLISPADKAGFLSALVAHTPHLEHLDDRLLPRRESAPASS